MADFALGFLAGMVVTCCVLAFAGAVDIRKYRTQQEKIADNLDDMADTCLDFGDTEYVVGLRAAADYVRTWEDTDEC